MRAVLPTMALLAFGTPADAEVREVVGQTGFLGEWELTATVTERSADNTQEFVGPLKLKHVGVCTQDGPEERTGELRLRVSGSSTRVSAILLIEATECSYTGDLTTSSDGVMNCPDRRGVPLSLWIK